MPIYEFQCQDCANEFESLAINQNEISACIYCGSKDIKRIISLVHYRHADHWEKDMQRGLARSQEFDERRTQQKMSV